MPKISKSVGKNGINFKSDVIVIQRALNKIKPPLSSPPLVVDGVYGKNTATAILVFQKKHVKMFSPDGRIDPGGRSIRILSKLVDSNGLAALFPLRFKPDKSYKKGSRAFGSKRSNGHRKHAGVDLYAPKGTPIRAMKDGKVIASYPFYLGPVITN
jgi:murein DD-endopeptidase MepM/ murein hydrolase activator NlpD